MIKEDTSEKMEHALAIVIPYYKKDFFNECLNSLKNQTNKDFNLYVGDDASPDDPIEVLKQFKDDLDVKYVRFDNNLGSISLTSQWMRCLTMTLDEPWIMILCDDDLLSPTVVDQFYFHRQQIEKHNIQVVKYATQVIDGKGEPISKVYKHPRIQPYSRVFEERFFKDGRSSLSEHMFTRGAYEKHGFRDVPLAWHADDYAWMDFSEFGDIYSINDALVFFRMSDQNISRADYEQITKWTETFKYFNFVLKHKRDFLQKDQIIKVIDYLEWMTYQYDMNKKDLINAIFWQTLRYKGGINLAKFVRRLYINRS
ncbi:glycosyltransferase family 2 protein [Nonlabens ponticola]|uniref:Glycosyltransferase family 2 protein n=1 Tax=Nonlabens ponticola TaxID=2496866 RepID=A0A3S9MX69_9FLAO|nr:glycosyltransferase [Nonlabens ponticola]AZQ43866.1 glycosyltransferase family 2 protein [Nonlabens ponticola]